MNNAEILNHIMDTLGRSLQQWRFLSIDRIGCRIRFANGNECRIARIDDDWCCDDPWILARLNGSVRDEQGVVS
jgi:hypothetical protein